MKTTFKILVLFVIFLTTFSSCFEGFFIEGNNQMVEENRQLPSFNQIYSEGSFNVYYSHGDSTSVKIDCESNLLPYIETAVYNKKLDIRFASHVSVITFQEINIYVTSPSMEKIDLSGSGNVIADSINGKDVELSVEGSGNITADFYGQYLESSVSGSGKIDIQGKCDTLEATISGSGDIYLDAPGCLYTSVDISGSGKAELEGSSDKASFKIVGSGDLKAYNFPVKKADVHVSGSGTALVNVIETLNAVVSGSGDIYYIGYPKVTYSESNSGSIHNAN
jgi:hypothetical protein